MLLNVISRPGDAFTAMRHLLTDNHEDRAAQRRHIHQAIAIYRALLAGHPRLDQTVFDQGTTVFPRLIDAEVDALFQRLTSERETSFVPGRFFGRPQHFRIGLAGDVAMTRTGLERLAEALDAL